MNIAMKGHDISDICGKYDTRLTAHQLRLRSEQLLCELTRSLHNLLRMTHRVEQLKSSTDWVWLILLLLLSFAFKSTVTYQWLTSFQITERNKRTYICYAIEYKILNMHHFYTYNYIKKVHLSHNMNKLEPLVFYFNLIPNRILQVASGRSPLDD